MIRDLIFALFCAFFAGVFLTSAFAFYYKSTGVHGTPVPGYGTLKS